MAARELLYQGAEARVYNCTFLGKSCILKERFTKKYRVAELDQKITQQRINQEVRTMARCRRHGIACPAVYHVDNETKSIYMEHVSGGKTVRDFIRASQQENKEFNNLAPKIGAVLAAMHDCDVIHGDLTTSNMIYDQSADKLTLIDFGLSSVSTLTEDKGVDLYVLERAILSSHPNTEDFFQLVLTEYQRSSAKASSIISKLDEVRLRGRKRTMVG
ncbi:EKC/KEOPS complex subunit TP53RK-like [Dysidea avara]|uniref:EKC/KEOPS complex subunit TP53RK-like n=1 Tax=Dysidea avara TaxID=196820 RepID=UPI00331B67FE